MRPRYLLLLVARLVLLPHSGSAEETCACSKQGAVRLPRRLLAILVLGWLFLSVTDSFAAGADTAAAEQLIRIHMKMGIVVTRIQAWLAAGGTPQQVEAFGQDVAKFLTSGELAKAETSMDSLFNIVVGSTAPSESARITTLASQIVGLHSPIERWMAAGGDPEKVTLLWGKLGGALMAGSLDDIATRIDDIDALVATPALCDTTTTTTAPATTATLVGTMVSTFKNSAPGIFGFRELMNLVTGAGVNFFLFSGDWGNLEPSPGTFDFQGLVQPLTEMGARYPQFKGFGFTIRMLNAGRRSTPADLDALPFDNTTVLERFDALIDALAAEPLSAKLGFIIVGNEVDASLADPTDAAAFVTFYRRAVDRIHLKLPRVKVGTILTSGGAMRTATKLFADVSALSDFVAYTYYPIGGTATGTWVMRPVSEVKSDLDWLAALACGKPFAFTEIGYSFSAANNSSEPQQADFVREVFDDLDTYRTNGRLAFFQYHSLYDLPPDACDAYTIEDSAVAASICSFLRSGGLRSYDTGLPRAAWDAFVAGIDQWTK